MNNKVAIKPTQCSMAVCEMVWNMASVASMRSQSEEHDDAPRGHTPGGRGSSARPPRHRPPQRAGWRTARPSSGKPISKGTAMNSHSGSHALRPGAGRRGAQPLALLHRQVVGVGQQAAPPLRGLAHGGARVRKAAEGQAGGHVDAGQAERSAQVDRQADQQDRDRDRDQHQHRDRHHPQPQAAGRRPAAPAGEGGHHRQRQQQVDRRHRCQLAQQRPRQAAPGGLQPGIDAAVAELAAECRDRRDDTEQMQRHRQQHAGEIGFVRQAGVEQRAQVGLHAAQAQRRLAPGRRRSALRWRPRCPGPSSSRPRARRRRRCRPPARTGRCRTAPPAAACGAGHRAPSSPECAPRRRPRRCAPPAARPRGWAPAPRWPARASRPCAAPARARRRCGLHRPRRSAGRWGCRWRTSTAATAATPSETTAAAPGPRARGAGTAARAPARRAGRESAVIAIAMAHAPRQR